MKTGKYDAVIVGGGISGLMAAIDLTRKGRRVAVVSKGDPICCLSTGCIDILKGVDSPRDGICDLPENHPYHLVGAGGLDRAAGLFVSVMKEAGLSYVGNVGQNRWILSPGGTRKQTALVPESMAHGNVEENETLVVIIFKGMKDFFPGYVTAKFQNADVYEFDPGNGSTLGIATKFDDPAFQEDFFKWFKSQKISKGKIALPAVLGTKPQVFGELAQKLDRKIFEIPTLPPSIPGLRMFKALKTCLQDAGADLYWGRSVESVEKDGDAIEAVTLAGIGRSTRIEARAFILATGSFVSGGLYARQDGVVKESVFDLPAYVPENRESWFGHNFFETGHGIEKAGIRVNGSFQPESTGIPNLFVCGSILAFSETMKYGCGHGMAIATGVTAAEKCEDHLA
ncbi:MAG: anaerobic glycerol-3-phosphate dehydrogenase subunit B [Desulfobacterium sp.]|nr:anaerobic glycerol-3-phosphate dehydrogenase subunit B [Desulfobacterium sp.]